MRKFLIALGIILFVSSNTFAEEISLAQYNNCEKGYCTAIDCEKGKCDGWEGSYEAIPGTGAVSGAYRANFFFRNRTGKTAFNIKIALNYYDSLGDFVGRLIFREEGPVSQWIPESRISVPQNASKITYDIYWSEDYVPQGQIGG